MLTLSGKVEAAREALGAAPEDALQEIDTGETVLLVATMRCLMLAGKPLALRRQAFFAGPRTCICRWSLTCAP